MKRFFNIILPVLMLAVLALPVEAMAAGKVQVDDSYVRAAESIVVDQNISGTAILAGNDVTVNGNIDGDLFVAGERVDINGTVNGNVYVASNSGHIGGKISGDCFAAGNTVFVEPDTVLSRDLFVAGSNMFVNAPVGRHLYAGGDKLTLNSAVNKNARLKISNISFTDKARVGGSLYYEAAHKITVPAGVVAGNTVFKLKKADTPKAQESLGHVAAHSIKAILAGLLVWFILSLVRRDFWSNASGRISARPFMTVGVGALVLIVTPVLAVILLVTIIGIPLAMLLTLAYLAALYLSKVVTAAFLGGLLAKRFPLFTKHRGVWSVLIGLIVVQAILEIPVVGFFGGLIMLLLGLGALFLTLSPVRQWKQIPAGGPALPQYPTESQQ